jgi:NADPH:quinone reductase-like Zn-dependent oxidoreductase
MRIRKVRIHRFGGPEVFGVDEVEQSMPDALQVLVSVKAASVNPVDIKIRKGQYPAVKEDRLPYTLGRDVSGTVEKCGAQATQFKIGDEVLGAWSAYAAADTPKRLCSIRARSRANPHRLTICRPAPFPWQA